MPKFLEKKLKKEYGAESDIPYKVMNKMGVMNGNKEIAKEMEMEKKHHSGKGTRSRLENAAEKMMFGTKKSK